MNNRHSIARKRIVCVIAIICGIALNVLCALPNDYSDSPFYIDTIGTIAISMMAGAFPGVLTGVLTNIIKVFSYDLSPYYAVLNASIALTVVIFRRSSRTKKVSGLILLILTLAFIGGVPGSFISWMLSGPNTNPYITSLAGWFSAHIGTGVRFSELLSNFVFDIGDKTISVLAALFIVRIVPERIKNYMSTAGLRQAYVIETSGRNAKVSPLRSLKIGTVSMIGLVTIVAVFAMTWVAYMLFGSYSKEHAEEAVRYSVGLASVTIDEDKINDYLRRGRAAEGYEETEELLYFIRNTTTHMSHLFVAQFKEDGCHIVFDLQNDDAPTYNPGTIIPYVDAYEPYVEPMIRGEKVEVIESVTERGWVYTVFEPIYDESGKCICYVGGDIDASGLVKFQNLFVLRVTLITLALLILGLTFSMRIAMNRLIIPINSMAGCAAEFIEDYDESRLAENVKRINRLQISTGDEIENLYHSFQKMAVDTVAHERNIRRQAEAIGNMQNALIEIMADMVENRDNDTGNHTKRTASYVRIIMEGLKKKGYYNDQLTDRYMDDVIRSAPLHDVGKIGISDIILNKPGKLTPEEFDIMKSHVTIGKDLLERAMSEIHSDTYLSEARNLAAYHHEKWNGKGYIAGLSGEEIPLSARIMAVADVFDAISQKRVYKEAFSFEKSVDIIRSESGESFDPKIVEVFLDSLDEIRCVLENDGEEGIAI